MSRFVEPRLFKLRLAIVLPAYLVFAQVCALAAALCIAGITLELSAESFLKFYLAFATVGAVIAIAHSLRVTIWHRIGVGPKGIHSYPGLAEPAYWDAIHTVRITRWSVLSYLELETQKNRKHRFPLYVADLPGFVEAVERFAGEDHPLTWALWEWMEAESE